MASGNLTLTLKNMTQCVEFPPHIHSAGIFSYKTSAGIPYTLPNLEMQMVLIFCMTQAFYFVLRYFGVPRFSTQVIVRASFYLSYFKRIIVCIIFTDHKLLYVVK